MSENRIFLDHDLLVAYVDQELPPDRLAAVDAALIHDAEAWETVRLLRLSAKAAARAFAPVIDEPIPARLRAAAGGTVESGNFGAPRPRMRAGWPMALAAGLAALAVGLGAGYSLRGIVGGMAGGAYTPASAVTVVDNAGLDPLSSDRALALAVCTAHGVSADVAGPAMDTAAAEPTPVGGPEAFPSLCERLLRQQRVQRRRGVRLREREHRDRLHRRQRLHRG